MTLWSGIGLAAWVAYVALGVGPSVRPLRRLMRHVALPLIILVGATAAAAFALCWGVGAALSVGTIGGATASWVVPMPLFSVMLASILVPGRPMRKGTATVPAFAFNGPAIPPPGDTSTRAKLARWHNNSPVARVALRGAAMLTLAACVLVARGRRADMVNLWPLPFLTGNACWDLWAFGKSRWGGDGD